VIPHPTPPAGLHAALPAWTQAAAVILYALAQILIVLYASHRYLLLWR
jgi:hypothetical protein